MVFLDHEKKFQWDSRKHYIMALLCQTLSGQTFVSMPQAAASYGSAGYLLGYLVTYVIIGVPLLYMEFVVSQFTARDCLQVWTIRPCMSHIGYVQLFWQIFIVIYNHVLSSFVIHYFLISFENPIPYLMCGTWATSDCGILEYNYTINQDCVKYKHDNNDYCASLFKTFPGYQYWRFYLLEQNNSNSNYYNVAWRVCLASAIACSIIFLSSFRRKTSLKWCLSFITIYPVVGYTVLMVGSMMQKGIVNSYVEAMDTDFTIFVRSYRISGIVQQVLFALNIGTGVSFNLGASTSFRAPCYANVVIAVAICAVFTTFAVCTLAMMTCPFAYQYKMSPNSVVNYAMALVFEKIPTLLKEYNRSYFWLIISFSCNAVLGLSTNIIICQHLLEMLSQRYKVVERYPGLTCCISVVAMFFVTIPLLGKAGVYTSFAFKRIVHLIAIFITILECLVFVVWYGLEKFSEDVHFMQGIQHKSCMKLAWLLSGVAVSYVFFNEVYVLYIGGTENFGSKLGWCTLLTLLGFIISITLIKCLVAAIKNQFKEVIKLDSSWGPRSDVLMRSRAMFSAQAMTKEYIYRQYHLQAAILARQRISNIRHAFFE